MLSQFWLATDNSKGLFNSTRVFAAQSTTGPSCLTCLRHWCVNYELLVAWCVLALTNHWHTYIFLWPASFQTVNFPSQTLLCIAKASRRTRFQWYFAVITVRFRTQKAVIRHVVIPLLLRISKNALASEISCHLSPDEISCLILVVKLQMMFSELEEASQKRSIYDLNAHAGWWISLE